MSKQIIQAVLTTLNLVGDRALPFSVIASQVRGSLVMPAADEDILAGIRQCQEQGWIERKVDTFDHSETWYLVDAGRIALRSHR